VKGRCKPVHQLGGQRPFTTDFGDDRLLTLDGSGEFVHVHTAPPQKASNARVGIQEGEQVVFYGNYGAPAALNALAGMHQSSLALGIQASLPIFHQTSPCSECIILMQ
jgi:hypothetical protein